MGKEILNKNQGKVLEILSRERGLEVFNKLKIDSINDIAVNKLFTIYQKPRARDFIDLYLILKKKQFSFDNLIKSTRLKFDWHIDPLTLGTQFMKVKEVIDYPRMVKKIDNRIWQEYFIKIADKLKGKIF